MAFGLGNAVADQRLPDTRDGLTAQVDFTPTATGGYTVAAVRPVPTWMSTGRTMRWLDTRATAGVPAATARALRSASQEVLAAIRSPV